MSSGIETRGRKSKNVDADMFLELITYYRERDEQKSPKIEHHLLIFMKRFRAQAEHFELMRSTQTRLMTENPSATDGDINKLMYKADFRGYGFGSAKITQELFDTLRTREIRESNTGYTSFNNVDIENANELFKDIPKVDSDKLKGRLRKAKLNESQGFGGKKIGLDLDRSAYNLIRSFTEQHGFKTHSISVLVMSGMINHSYSETPFENAINSIIKYKSIDKSDLFKNNADIEQVLSLVSDKRILRSSHKFFMISSLPQNSDFEVAEIKNTKILHQLFNSKRIEKTSENHQATIIGSITNDGEMKIFESKENEIKEELNILQITQDNPD